jgi:hypothetical protein
MTSTRDTSQPIVQLGTRGTVVHADDAQLDALRTQFAERDFVRLPQLLAPTLSDRVMRAVETGAFEEHLQRGTGTLEENLSDSNVAVITLHLVANCPTFFELISRITQCGPIASFLGRVYRRLAALGHYGHWHTDAHDPRRVAAMTLNLSEDHRGGELELRRVETASTAVIENGRLGDAVVFRIAPELQHRVRPVEGNVFRTVFAGWFFDTPDFAEILRKNPL